MLKKLQVFFCRWRTARKFTHCYSLLWKTWPYPTTGSILKFLTKNLRKSFETFSSSLKAQKKVSSHFFHHPEEDEELKELSSNPAFHFNGNPRVAVAKGPWGVPIYKDRSNTHRGLLIIVNSACSRRKNAGESTERKKKWLAMEDD